jgi:CHAT domain-containing protein/Tfp pilus assembly protein PilF
VILETALGKNHPEVSYALVNLATSCIQLGLYAQAEPLYQRGLALMEATLGKNHPTVAYALINLGNLYDTQGFYTRAEELHARALAIREEALGKNHPDVAQALNNLGSNYQFQGFYAQAQVLFQRALAIREEVLGKNHPDIAFTLSNLARVHEDQGLNMQARPLYERALTIREAAFGKNHPDVAYPLSSLANLYTHEGLYTQAEPLHQRALAIREAALGENHPRVAASLFSLANLYVAQGFYARAEPLYQRALAIEEATLGEHHPYVADSLTSLANLYMAQGLHVRAEPLFERALAIREAAFGRKHPDIVTALTHLARLRLAQQKPVEALSLLERAFTASEEFLRQEALGLSEARLASTLRLMRKELESPLYTLVRAYPDDERVRRVALSAALLRKGRSVEEFADLSRIIYRGLSQGDREVFERLRALRTQLSTLSSSPPGSLSPADYQQQLKKLADRGDLLEIDLATRSKPLRALSVLPLPNEIIGHVSKALPRHGVLIEFVAYHDSPLWPTPGAPSSQEPGQLRYLVFLLFSDGRSQAVDLGPAELIDSAALRLHDALARKAVSYQPAAQALYKRIFRPLLPHLGQAQHLFLSPDSQLALVPFAALHDGRRFLSDTLDITYLTSGKDLLPHTGDTSPERSVVVLADPDFGTPPAAPLAATRGAPGLAERSVFLERFFSSRFVPAADSPWTPLPGTRKEAEAIQRLFPQAQVLVGPAATKQALLTLDTPGILHIATHGFFREDAADPSLWLPDPLLRSGLVLAGGSAQPAQSRPRRREDTLLTALELSGLDLWGTQLVVLSACDTGRGDIRLGQGVYGLRRALMIAGAESLVTSLWKVNDETSYELMESYYGNLLARQGRAGALRAAMRALRQKHPHPYYWAPFVLIGKDAPLQELGGAPP